MKNTFKALKFSIVSFLLVSFFLACDKDFTVIESDVLGEENSNFNASNEFLQISAYNKKLDSLQINRLNSNLLGVYNDPVYGQTTASFVSQITPTSFSPDFGDSPVIDSVILNIPYFSRIIGTDNGNPTYTILDSLYGESATGDINPIKLTVYQNNYFLRDFDPSSNINAQQNYYSKGDGTINATDNFALNGSSVINFDSQKGDDVYKTEAFTPSGDAIKTSIGVGEAKVTTQSAPALRAALSVDFWKAAILDREGDDVLNNANNFNDYFRGLYFKAEAIAGNGHMLLLNLASTNAGITIYYSKDPSVDGERTQASYSFRFTGNILNTFINDYSSVTLQNGNKTTGDEKLYIKGTEGSMAVVNLFGGMVECEDDNGTITLVTALECFKNTYIIPIGNGEYKKDDLTGNYILKRLINDAQLIVYEDESMTTLPKDKNGSDYSKFDRLYAYDLKNNRPLIDYSFDPTNNTTDPFSSTSFHLGQRRPDESSGVAKYKIHLTEHLNNILIRDSTNTKIGLVLSTNVNYTASAKILNSEDDVVGIPAAAILTPRGTILHGTKANVPENRKMKLQLFFTEPK
jgi:hypothetical protein